MTDEPAKTGTASNEPHVGDARPDASIKGRDDGRQKLAKKTYERELARLQLELVKMEDWVKAKGLRVVVIFEGRDAAGKGGVIKAITASANPRIVRVVALAAPTEREKGSGTFTVRGTTANRRRSRLVRPSWYNRAGVDRVMGFANEEQVEEFFQSGPAVRANAEPLRNVPRQVLVLGRRCGAGAAVPGPDQRSGEAMEAEPDGPRGTGTLGRLFARQGRNVEYTDTEDSPWWVSSSDDKRRAHLNAITHLLGQIPYAEVPSPPLVLPPRQRDDDYVRPAKSAQRFVPDLW